jgi:CheY-like chemotaxis protein
MTTADVRVLPQDPLVLVVDDELTPRAIVTRMVRSLGYRARSCQSGRGALRFLKSHPGLVHLLLTDLGMPQMDGGELAGRTKELDPGLIVMLMADPTDPRVGDLLSGYGHLPFLPMPVNLSDLAEKLERLLGIPAQPTSPPQSMASARRRERQRPSGSHQG